MEGRVRSWCILKQGKSKENDEHIDTLGIRLPVDFANFYQIVQSTSSTESYSEGFTLIASILHKIVSSTVSEQT